MLVVIGLQASAVFGSPISVLCAVLGFDRSGHAEASMPKIKINEWEILRNKFHALTRDESVESIEDILDEQFRRRFAELINQTAQRNSTNGYNWPR
jgi:hypothetical protein